MLLVGFAGALHGSELAAIRFEQLEKTDRGIRLTLPQTKVEQTDAVTVSCPYGDIKLCPVRALKLWQQTGGLTAGPVFRKIRLPPGHKAAVAGRVSHASDRQRRDHPHTVGQIFQARAMAASFGGATEAATTSNAGRSPPGWIAASIRRR